MSRVTRKFKLGTLLAGEHAMMIRDSSTPVDQTRTGVTWHHGRSYSAAPYCLDALGWTFSEYPINEMAKAGYIVAQGDDYSGHPWARPEVMTSIANLRTKLISPYSRAHDAAPTGMGAKAGKTWIAGFSLGTLGALRFAMLNPTLVHGLVLFCPATDMVYHRGTGGVMPAEMDAEWGGSAALTTAMPTINPAQNASLFANLPIRIYTSSNDTSCPPASITPFVSAVTAAGNTNCAAISMGAIGHSPGSNFAGGYNQDNKVPGIFEDMVAWMKSVAAP